MAEARRAIAARGETPITLAVDPYGAEIASPARTFATESKQSASPDPKGKIHRDRDRLIECEVTLVPSRIRPGGTVRVHLTMQPNSAKQSHWNNESEPLRVWVDTPEGWQISQRLLTARAVAEATSREVRHIDFEVQAPANATGKIKLPAYALYFVCEDIDGRCLFLRHDIEIQAEVVAR